MIPVRDHWKVHVSNGMNRPRVAAIVPAAGLGKRLGSGTRKPFVLLGGKPLVIHALQRLSSSSSVDSIIVASEASCVKRLERLVKRFRLYKVKSVVAGGKTRSESVGRCLRHVGPRFDIVLIHDGARPFPDSSLIERSIKLAAKFGACVVAIPEIDTVKQASRGMFVEKTLDRSRIFRAQTPQTFRRDIIIRAYSAGCKHATDDSGLAEELGCSVKILEGNPRNIKITTKEDLRAAKTLL